MRNSIAITAAALSIAASFVIVRLPLPVAAPAEAGSLPPVVVVTEVGGGWDCPDEVADS